MKCGGGLLVETWQHLENFGVPTERCNPYVSSEGYVPGCPTACVSSIDQFYRFKAVKSTTRRMTNSESIKSEISTMGPVVTGMKTYEDFMTYNGGIYEYKWGRETDPHAVTIVGYGYDSARRNGYWIIRNSWGPKWGENGYFRIYFNSVNNPESNACAADAPNMS